MATRKSQRSKVKGFTLVEFLVFTVVAGMVMIILLSTLISFLDSRNTAKRLSALQDVATYVFNELTQEVHWSDDVEEPIVGNELTLIQEPGKPTETRTTFSVVSVDGRGQFFKQVGDEPAAPISLPEVEVNSFTVTNRAQPDKVPCLEIQLELQYPDPKKTILSEHKTTISLRKTKIGILPE